jgi:hypothetical protein
MRTRHHGAAGSGAPATGGGRRVQHAVAKGAKWIATGFVNFFVPILAPIWTPFVDSHYHVIFTERNTHAQFDR